jgi:hypothetical protein
MSVITDDVVEMRTINHSEAQRYTDSIAPIYGEGANLERSWGQVLTLQNTAAGESRRSNRMQHQSGWARSRRWLQNSEMTASGP